ncbi:dynein heavy chain 7, axonemal-like [Ctenocephalides felis]|uniref:dynein heavy chain 7, axonemal-like n=1 Tax=Ctenocephalides felis TaxID=7515 RepID=UPI000E6E3D09|nr:dynein heavy chain 7, axonemal-like [Ctenocephalides felis]
MNGLIEAFSLDIYRAVCRSLFVKDKLLLSFMLAINTLKLKNQVDHMELLMLLQIKKNCLEVGSNSPFSWFEQQIWNALCSLEKCTAFNGIAKSIEENEDLWKKFNATLSKNDLPKPFCDNFNNFQMLVLSVVMNPDKTVNLMQKFVAENLGELFLESPPFELKSLYGETDCCTPLMILLSPGVDPFCDIIKFGELQGVGSDKMHYISLGNGQDALASKLLDECMKNGYWAILQNCHLAKNWLKNLEKVYDNISPESVQPEFRLWMLSSPSEHIPFSILKNSVKLVDEVPAGIRSSIHQSYLCSPISENSWFKSGPEERAESFKKLLYGLCFLHALLQQRARYEAWNYRYDFCLSDMRTAAVDLKILVEESLDDEDISFETLCYLAGECVYGGRLRDDWDRRCLNTLLEQFYCPNLIKNSDYTFYNTDIRIVPSNQTYPGHMNHTNNLSLFDSTDAVGLGANAEILKNQRKCERFFDLLVKEPLPEDENYIRVLQMIEEISKQIPEMYDEKIVQDKFAELENDNVSIFLLQELQKYGILVKCILETLETVKTALSGSVITSVSVEKVFQSLLNNQIPEKWLKFSYPSIKTLGSYIVDLGKRITYLQVNS